MRSYIRRVSRLTNLAPSAVAALLLIGILTLSGCAVARDPAYNDGNYRVVERVIDGDTLLMEERRAGAPHRRGYARNQAPEEAGGAFRQRGCRIHTPLGEGKRVQLEFDPANAPRAHKDSRQ